MAILAKGAAVAEQIADEEKKNRPGFYRVPDLVIKDGDRHILRFATEIDALTTIGVHRFMPTKPKPESCDWDKWPEKMWAVCANDAAFRVRDGQGNMTPDFEDGYGNCYLCATYAGQVEVVQQGGKSFKTDKGRPQTMTYGLAVMCQPQTDRPGGNVIGFAEEEVEFKATSDVLDGGEVIAKEGELVRVPKFVLVGQRYSTFWHPVKATAYLPPQIIRDKVYMVVRKGSDITVTSVATDQPGANTWLRYDQALLVTGFSVDEYLLDHASPDHYAKFFDPARLPEGGYSRKGDDDAEEAAGTAATPAAQAGPDIDQAALQGFADRLGKRGGK